MRDGWLLWAAPMWLLAMALLCGCQDRGDTQGTAGIQLQGQDPKGLLADYYEPVEAKPQPKVPAYTLPLKRGDICNPNDAPIQAAAWDGLLRNGFVVVPYARTEDLVEVYRQQRRRDKPVFVTTDTVLHLYHVQFDETLKAIEERDFHPRIVRFSQEMLKASQADYGQMQGELKEAARRNMAYFSVGLSLLTGQTQAPGEVRREVEAELKLIEAHGGFEPSPIFLYKEDYSQYVPRGHYTRSELLKRYFKGLMWYGRISMLLKGKTAQTSGLIDEKDARIQTLQACLIAAHLYAPGSKLVEDWDRIYGVTAFYVGTADDLTPYEYAEAMKKICGASFEWSKLAQDETIHALRSELATYRAPQIYGGTGDIVLTPPFSPEQLDKALADTKGMRLMGQRFIPDSYMFEQLVFPAIEGFTGAGTPFTLVQAQGGPVRGFPRGLDVMAVLRSERALQILKDEGDTAYRRYDEQLAKLRQQSAGFTQKEWNRNLYWSWLYALQALVEPCGEGYPTFMQGEAWQDRRLWAALGSWAELRHDTILYAKQSYTMVGTAAPGLAPAAPPPSYVEPAPEFYARLLALAKMTRSGLTAMDVLDEEAQGRLQELEGIIQKLLDISLQELRNEKLSEEDYGYIDGIADRLEAAVLGVEEVGLKTTMVADVHTDGNTRQCLEEGVGYVHLLVACYPVPDGRIAVGTGPVLSQYEFKHPMADRLTDEAWRELLQSQPPEAPKWTASFVVGE
jgi:hypothetical protein